jgi:RNA polymerase sigma-70 factor, ECF subfamily
LQDSVVGTGRADELGRLYEEHRDRLWRGVYATCGDPDVASDAVAEAFAQALRRGDAIRDPLAWVWRAAFRISAGELKARSRRIRAEAAEETYELPEAGRQLIDELSRLSPKQRAALVLRYFEGYSTREIAEIIGSTTAAVRVHLAVGRRRLRDILGGRDDA